MMQRLSAVLMVVALASPAAALAGGKGKGKGKGKGGKVVFIDNDRQVVRTWWVDTYGRDCPPGLAKKGNGCLPPGQAKKRYVVGRRLPSAVVVESVPPVLLPRLRPAPVGYQYVVVDGDVLLMATTTRLVADAITRIFD